MEFYASLKRNEIMSFAGMWMELESIILSKLTQEQKTKHDMDTRRGTTHTGASQEREGGHQDK